MTLINLIDGEKGGVGKSFFARVMSQYYIDTYSPYYIVDADGANPDVSSIYKNNSLNLLFSEVNKKAHEADKIFELALSKNLDKGAVIVNLPANIYYVVNMWLERNRLLDISLQNGVKFCKWFVCSGGFDSVSLFKQSLKHHKNKLIHIFVKNLGLTDEWKFLNDDLDFQNLLLEYQDTVIVTEFPLCDYYERYFLEAKKVPFSNLFEDDEIPYLSKQRIQYFLEAAYKQIKEVLSKPQFCAIKTSDEQDEAREIESNPVNDESQAQELPKEIIEAKASLLTEDSATTVDKPVEEDTF